MIWWGILGYGIGQALVAIFILWELNSVDAAREPIDFTGIPLFKSEKIES